MFELKSRFEISKQINGWREHLRWVTNPKGLTTAVASVRAAEHLAAEHGARANTLEQQLARMDGLPAALLGAQQALQAALKRESALQNQTGSSNRWHKSPGCRQETKATRCAKSGLGLSSLRTQSENMGMFTLSPHASAAETTQRSRLHIAPHDLVARFGPPLPGSADRKVSGSYTFTDIRSNVITVYDWKATALYDGRPEADLPTVKAFWASKEPTEFCIAARGTVDIRAFARWLESGKVRPDEE